ncbi:glycosyltransferase family 4 protein [Desulfosoma caldarium]|uniref:Glycosyltransferase involved in cell wall biosynthesis n=1 Tax=Desulfosoma caldarium TaxID=610254 RepID=A0A3N1VM12_9BACT|nr:glycosyltransferase family 4 protein [Desulfosoma caldarium]ROR03089.1 glycosyltransferase involved in cell wall biosynthesis [Desulfosoma caldarium]
MASNRHPSERPASMVYLSRARLHRPRANVIQTLKTVEGLERIGVPVELHLPPWKGQRSLEELLAHHGVTRPLDIRAHAGLRSLWKPIGFAPFFWKYEKTLRQSRAVFTRSADLSLVLIRRGISHSFEVHDMDALCRHGTLERLLEAHARGLLRHFFPISHAAARGLMDRGVTPACIHVCPCGADLSLFQDMAPWNPSGLTNPHVMYLGRISRDRGLDILEALAERAGCRVTVVGVLEDRPKTDRLQVVPFVPHRKVPRYLEQADIVVMPYQRHLAHAGSISPMKLFEAMAAGRPILVSDLEPIREIIHHGQNGLCVPPDDEKAWIEAVRFLREHPQEAHRMAIQAQKDASRFGWESRARRLQEVLWNNNSASEHDRKS